MGEEDGAHGSPGDSLLGIFRCVTTVHMFQRHFSPSLPTVCVDVDCGGESLLVR